MASHSSPPGSPGRPSAPSGDAACSSSSSTSAPPPRSFLFRRRRRPPRPTPPPSPSAASSKKPQPQPQPSPKPRLIGPLSFSDFFQEEFTPVMTELFITLGVLHYVAKHCSHLASSLETYDILKSLQYITDQCADEVPLFSTDESKYTLALAIIEPTVPHDPSRPDLHPDLNDVWEWTIGPCRELENVLKNGLVKLAQAALKITKMPLNTTDRLLLYTYPQMARNLKQAAHSFEAMYKVVRRQIELEIEEAHKDRADALTDPAGDDDPPVSS
ncbi:hypothetical protein J5N97_028950 [Dioscorea zingiberensis]|uniref:Uncharacterized protein n=1 Tax=Dioscorea zingiberensis TaxID=325984 RepID=A0A9D5H5D6_9LILI|nr:hypothetical protein J5N97_028950 [Dioscorea zingiberensis]